MSDKNQVLYSVNPTPRRPPPPAAPFGTCKASFGGVLWAFTISGAGFANSDYGAALLTQLKGCGAVTGWTFTYGSTAAAGTEWTASGNLPITIKSGCVGRAVKSAGGWAASC